MCEAGVAADVPEFPQRSCGALWSHLCLNESHLQSLYCGGAEVNRTSKRDHNGCKAAALCVCVTGDLHMVQDVCHSD